MLGPEKSCQAPVCLGRPASRGVFFVLAVVFMGNQLAPRCFAGSASAGRRVAAEFGQLPLSFQPNLGQTDARVQFVSHGDGYSLYLAPGEACVRLENQPSANSADVLRMKLAGADTKAVAAGLDKQAGVVNYFVGNDPKKWRSGIPTYGKVRYAGIYPGIDLVFYGNQRQLEYDFLVGAAVDPGQIAWQIEGAKLSVDAEGDLRLDAPNGPASFKRPVIYQMDGDRRIAVEGRYVVSGNRVKFALGKYDRARPLVIDPILVYMTYLGGKYNSAENGQDPAQTNIGFNNWSENDNDAISNGIAVDKEGSVYVTGYTNAYDFPVKEAFQSSPSYMKDDSRLFVGFVTKLNPEGTAIVYSTYLAGTGTNGGWTEPYAIAVDEEGSAYITGTTWDSTFPATRGALDTVCGTWNNDGVQQANCGVDGPEQAFVTKLSPDGDRLEYSTFLGAGDGDSGWAIAVDAKGRAYVAGASADGCDTRTGRGVIQQCFPTTENAFQPGTTSCVLPAGASATAPVSCYSDYAFVSVLNAGGTGLVYSTLIGFNTKLVANGYSFPANPQYSPYGGTGAASIALNSSGQFFVTGTTTSWYLPATGGAFEKKIYEPQDPQATDYAAWVAKFEPVSGDVNSEDAKIDYLTYLAPPASDKNDDDSAAGAIAADDEGNAYIAGVANGQGFPTTAGAFQRSCGESGFDECEDTGFVAKLNPSGTKLVWSTMFGAYGPGANGIGNVGYIKLDAAGNVYFAGSAGSTIGFPEVNPIEPNGENSQAFVAELNPAGTRLEFYSLVGSVKGYGSQLIEGLDLDTKGNIYLAGYTNSSGLATTKGAFQSSPPAAYGGDYGFIAKIAPVAPTATALKVTPEETKAGVDVILTATVTTKAYSPAPAGEVTFAIGSKTLGSAALNASGIAEFVAKGIKSGKYSFKASYEGNKYFEGSASAGVETTVPDVATALKAWVDPEPDKSR